MSPIAPISEMAFQSNPSHACATESVMVVRNENDATSARSANDAVPASVAAEAYTDVTVQNEQACESYASSRALLEG
eukprot:12207290-Karenia_brevis.AAC.1